MPADTPTTVAEYLDALQRAFGKADPALVQDALYDAEEYLRAELAQRPDRGEAAVLAELVGSYGAPEEVAAAYLATEATVARALSLKTAPARAAGPQTLWARFFGVLAEPQAYASLFYMLLALATGMFYFTWALIGSTVSASLLIFIIGIPVLLLFLGSTRLLSLIEGRIVETLLGERMPRRAPYPTPRPFLERVREMVIDARTWTTLLYMVLMAPLGLAYFMIAVCGLVLPFACVVAPLAAAFGGDHIHWHVGDEGWLLVDGTGLLPWPLAWLLVPFGAAGFVVTLHVARGIGRLHGRLAKALLVRV